MRPHLALLAVAALVLPASGCSLFEKSVPTDIVQKVFKKALLQAPNTASAMCGKDVHGLVSPTVTIKERGKKNTGVVHVKGNSMGGGGAPVTCEGDLEYSFSYETKRLGRNTRTTWNLERMKLVAIQTPGVKFSSGADEKTNADDE